MVVEEERDNQVTHLLRSVEDGEAGAAERLLEAVYSELRSMAFRKLSSKPASETINATALVDEVWMKLKPDQGEGFANRAHFFGAAAEAMRRILIDRARARLAAKRGGGMVPIELDRLEIPAPEVADDRLLDLHDALGKFAEVAPDKAELVKLRFFVGMTVEEAAAVLGIAVPTAKKWWAYARAWFRIEMS